MKCVVTGGAGFIGSNLVDELIVRGNEVVVIDNFRTGQKGFLANFSGQIIEADLLDNKEKWSPAITNADIIYHFAANADVKDGWKHPRYDLEQNVLATLAVLEVAVEKKVKEFIFSSTGSVYGETSQLPTPEDANFPNQTSLYGASKVSAEAFIAAYSEAGLIKSTVFRFVSALGQRYTHGHVIDFVRQLLNDPNKLRVLGDGSQTKSYMHVNDCVRGVIELRGKNSFEVFNLGSDEYCRVNDSIGWILSEMNLQPNIEYAGGIRGWIGDNPFIWLDVTKAKNHGWETQISIEDAVRMTVNWLLTNRQDL